jgi:uncharacterized protein with GYD domain
MALYFLLGTLTNEGQRMLHQNPDLVLQTSRNIQVDEAEILGQYAVLGRYDFVMMVQAADNDAVARMSLELGMGIGLHIETLPAIAVGFLSDLHPPDPDGRDTAVERPLEGGQNEESA